MNPEVQTILEDYLQKTTNVLLKLNQLSPPPESAPEVPLMNFFLLNSLLGSGGGGIGESVSVTNFPSDPAKNAQIIEVRDRLMPPGNFASYLGTSNGANLKSTAGKVFAFSCSNTNAAIRFFQLFNKASEAVDGDIPLISYPVLTDNGLLVIGQDVLGGGGIDLSVGISWAFSSTRLFCTLATAFDAIVTVRYE